MLSFWIVEKLDVIKYILPSLLAGGVGFRLIRSRLKSWKKALGGGIFTKIEPYSPPK